MLKQEKNEKFSDENTEILKSSLQASPEKVAEKVDKNQMIKKASAEFSISTDSLEAVETSPKTISPRSQHTEISHINIELRNEDLSCENALIKQEKCRLLYWKPTTSKNLSQTVKASKKKKQLP